MILGTVDPRRRAIVRLDLRGPDGQQEAVDFQVDTGFKGTLQVPLEVAVRLGLVQEEPVTMRLADGERIIVAVYAAVVIWDGAEKQVAMPAAGRQPLLETGLLDAHNLNVDIKPGGAVTITAL